MYKVSILWKELRDFLLLWLTQSLSGLGSAMTSYALIVWSYQQEGSALSTALLSICSYAPYVVMSIFAGALSDRWNKKRTLLWCDSFAAATTVAVLLMLRLGTLRLEYLYLINALNGLMNTIQQPAADVVNTLLTPKKHYQRVSGLRSLSSSAQSLLTPVLATALLAFAGLEAVLVVDLATFVLAFATLLGCIRIPPMPNEGARPEKVLLAARQGLRYLKGNPGILHLMLFLAAINLTASMYEAALPALLLNRGGEVALGMVSTVCGLAMLAGSLLASALPAPRRTAAAVGRGGSRCTAGELIQKRLGGVARNAVHLEVVVALELFDSLLGGGAILSIRAPGTISQLIQRLLETQHRAAIVQIAQGAVRFGQRRHGKCAK